MRSKRNSDDTRKSQNSKSEKLNPKQILSQKSKTLRNIAFTLIPLIIIFLLATVLAPLGWFNRERLNQKDQEIQIISGNNTLTLNVEIADSTEEYRIGLSNRTELENNSGMLFIFPNEQIRSFWMKDTLISLDIIFIDRSGQIINIAENTMPNQTTETYESKSPAKYVLEVNGGWCDKNSVKEGDTVVINN